jgi:hypothetical protein
MPSYLEIHARTAQSDLSCTQVSSGGNLGNNHGVLLVAQIEGFSGVRHGHVCLDTSSVEQVAIKINDNNEVGAQVRASYNNS